MNQIAQLIESQPSPKVVEKFLRDNFWPKDPAEFPQREFYYAIAKAHQPKTLLEIGVLGGRSMIAMLSACSCHAEGWDFEGYQAKSNQLALANLNARGLSDRVALHRLDTQKLALFPSFDMIHVDGDHSFEGALHDLTLASRATKVILYDDIYNRSTECVEAYAEFLRLNAQNVAWACILPHETGLAWVLMR